ncbi:MAG: hypothetical protein IJH32_04320 [Ruminococcus sp.]|nr:hypothetical protein [Ruminococcus sp.]
MKRILALLLALVMVIGVVALAGCSKNEPAPAETTADTETQAEETAAAPAESAPLALTPFTASVGDLTLSFEPIDLGFLKGSENTYEFAGEYHDGKYYISDESGKLLYVYTIDGTAATLENKYEFDDGFEKISVAADGKVYLSPGIFEASILNDDGTLTETTFRHDVEWSDTEGLGITTWVNADPTIIKDDEESEWVFKNLNDPETREGSLTMVFDCEIVGENILIVGTYAEGDEEDYRIGVFNFDGEELAMTDADDTVGNSALTQASGDVIITASVSNLFFHDSECKPIGEIKDLKTLAGFDSDTVTTFWVKELTPGEDGSVYMLAYVSKPDETCEALLYKVTGF